MGKLKKVLIISGFLLVIFLVVIEFGFTGSKNSGKVSLSITPTGALKNFSGAGNIFYQKPQSGEVKGWWQFVAQNNPGSGFELMLTPGSKCKIQAKQYVCAESMLSDGERVSVVGNQSGSALIIYSLSRLQ